MPRVLCACVLSLAASVAAAGPSEDLVYVLQPDGVAVSALTSAACDWLVLEPSVDGDAASDFSHAQIEQIRTGGPCPKKILAYLSIGEAEDYRDYWDPAWVDGAGSPIPGVAPAWLGPTNPDWFGNYKVRYWDPDWKALMFGTASGPGKTPLDRIIDQGFDGVYLDIIDGYQYWSQTMPELTRMEARARMIDFVDEIATYARVTRGKPGFLIVPQNASDIIRDDNDALDAQTTRYFSAVSGIGIEDLFYDEITPQPTAEVQYRLDQLAEFRARGKFVLVTDYVIRQGNPTPGANDARASDFITRTRAQGLVPYAAHRDRDLNEIVTIAGPGWSIAQPAAGCDGGSPTCPADLTGTADPNDPGFGVPDGLVDASDFFYYLGLFAAGDPQADLTGSADPNDPGFGVPDGTIDANDFFFYLDLFAQGCK